MDIFPLLYIFLQLILLSLSLIANAVSKSYIVNCIATLNLMFFFNGLYLTRKLIGLIQFFRPILKESIDTHFSSIIFLEPILRLAGMVILPFMFLFPLMRKNSSVTLAMCIYVIFNYTPNYINVLDTMLKSLFCISVFVASYSVLWLFQKLPFQTITE